MEKLIVNIDLGKGENELELFHFIRSYLITPIIDVVDIKTTKNKTTIYIDRRKITEDKIMSKNFRKRFRKYLLEFENNTNIHFSINTFSELIYEGNESSIKLDEFNELYKTYEQISYQIFEEVKIIANYLLA